MEFGQGGGVAPCLVKVFAVDVEGSGVDVVDHGGGGVAVDHGLHVAAAEEAGGVRSFGGAGFEGGADVGEGAAVLEADFEDGGAVEEEMHVAVDEAGDEELAAEVVYFSGGFGGFDFIVVDAGVVDEAVLDDHGAIWDHVCL